MGSTPAAYRCSSARALGQHDGVIDEVEVLTRAAAKVRAHDPSNSCSIGTSAAPNVVSAPPIGAAKAATWGQGTVMSP
jgi:hypothetical protein